MICRLLGPIVQIGPNRGANPPRDWLMLVPDAPYAKQRFERE